MCVLLSNYCAGAYVLCLPTRTSLLPSAGPMAGWRVYISWVELLDGHIIVRRVGGGGGGLFALNWHVELYMVYVDVVLAQQIYASAGRVFMSVRPVIAHSYLLRWRLCATRARAHL